MNIQQIKKFVVFSILMDSHDGITMKSPSYIDDKLKLVNISENPEKLLTSNNIDKYNKWLKIWRIE